MAQIIKFPQPRIDNLRSSSAPELSIGSAPPRSVDRLFLQRLLRGIHAALWVVIVLTSPLWRWFALADLLVQMIRATYLWNTPGTHAGAVLLAHALGVTALVVFCLCEPKAVR